MSAVLSFANSYWKSDKMLSKSEDTGEQQNGNAASTSADAQTEQAVTNETTSLLGVNEKNDPGKDLVHPLPDQPPTATEYYFNNNNPTAQ